MKVSASIAAVALLATSVLAVPAPEANGQWGRPGKYSSKGDKYGKWCKDDGKPSHFTSVYSITATPDQVVNGTEPTGGLPGAIGYYDFGIDRKKNIICYDIRLYGFRGQYESPALTATHIHEAAEGESGPPRIAFPNPKKTGKGDERRSKGCLKGPFTTGIVDEESGEDTGANFKVGEIEDAPEDFFCDVHSSLALPGAVRGQLDQ